MVRGTAGNENDTSAATDGGKVSLETTKGDLVVLEVDTTTHGINNGLRLFINFLLHKVVKGTLHDLSQFNLQGLNGTNG